MLKEIPSDLFYSCADLLQPYVSRAVAEALWRHKRLGQSIAVWRNGEAVILPPEEIPVEDDRPEWKKSPKQT